jgi:hypothetical protein
MRRAMLIVVALVLIVAPGIRRTKPLFHFYGPDSRLRLEPNGGWTAQLPVPDPYIDVIGRHIQQMHDRGYFRDFTSKDFWHGHFMLRPDSPGEYADAGELVSHAALMVYHTAEFSERWKSESSKPASSRNPRSLVGFWDGSVVPAINLVKPGVSMPFYESNGTISDSELRDSHPDWFNGTFDPSFVRLGSRASCAASLQFLILQDAWGRLTIGNMRYDVFLRCEIDPRELGLDPYQTRRRDYVTDDHPF